MVDLQKKYNWVLTTVTYDLMETLIKILKPLIIDPAMIKRQELRIIKAQEPEVISGKDFWKRKSMKSDIEQRRIVAYLDSVQARLASLRELQSATGEELSALLPCVLDRAFQGRVMTPIPSFPQRWGKGN